MCVRLALVVLVAVAQGAVVKLTGGGSTIEMNTAVLSASCPSNLSFYASTKVAGSPDNLPVFTLMGVYPSCANLPLTMPCVELSAYIARPPVFQCVLTSPTGHVITSSRIHATNVETRSSMGELLEVVPSLACPAVPASELNAAMAGASPSTPFSFTVTVLFNGISIGGRETVTRRSSLSKSECLTAGEKIVSPDGNCEAVLQTDGNFLVYSMSSQPIPPLFGYRGVLWASNTVSTDGASNLLCVLNDNRVVLSNGDGSEIWESTVDGPSSTDSTQGGLFLQPDGNLVMYSKACTGPQNSCWSSKALVPRDSENLLWPGGCMAAGSSLTSNNGEYKATMRSDGNFLVYKNDDQSIIWSTDTSGAGGRMCLQLDGNLVLDTGTGTPPLWAMNSWELGLVPFPSILSKGSRWLVMQDDSNLVVYDNIGKRFPVWSANGGVTDRIRSNDKICLMSLGALSFDDTKALSDDQAHDRVIDELSTRTGTSVSDLQAYTAAELRATCKSAALA